VGYHHGPYRGLYDIVPILWVEVTMPKLQFRDIPEVNRSFIRKDGYQCTIAESDAIGVFEVDMWAPPLEESDDRAHHWGKRFKNLDEALEEFNRWRD